jgi:hypothetical protein
MSTITKIEYCHQAHGLEDLDYDITSNRIRRPFYPHQITDRPKYFKLERKYWVLYDAQHDPFVQGEIRRYLESVNKFYDPAKVYSYSELQENKKIRGTILTYMLLIEMTKFVRYIFTTLGPTNPVPKSLLVHELQRVGFCQIG